MKRSLIRSVDRSVKRPLKVFLLLVFCNVSSSIFAQSLDISLSKKFFLKDLNIAKIEGPTYKIGDHYYWVEIDWKGMQFAYTAKLDKIKMAVILHEYDQDMKEVKKMAFRSGAKDFGPFEPVITLFQGQFLVFYYQAVEDNGIHLSVAFLDPETMAEKSHKDLYTISERNVGMFKMEKAVRHNRLILAVSPDKTKLFVTQSGNTDEYFTCVIDDKMEVKRSTTARYTKSADDFHFQAAAIDDAGTAYASYVNSEEKGGRGGVVVLPFEGKPVWLELQSSQGPADVRRIQLAASKDGSAMYAYSTYSRDGAPSGFALMTMTPAQASKSETKLFDFPPELKEKLHKLGYEKPGGMGGEDDKTVLSQLDDGTIVISGTPIQMNTSEFYSSGHAVSSSKVTGGPITFAFIKNGSAGFATIYRNQDFSQATGFLAIPSGGNLLVAYNDGEKNIKSADVTGNGKTYSTSDLVPVLAVLDGTGHIVSKTQAGGELKGLNLLLLMAQPLSDHTFLVPVGRETNNMARYYLETEYWATLDVH